MPNTVKLVEIDHVREKLVELIDDALQREEGTARVVGKRYVNTIADRLIDHSVTVQEWISASEPPEEHDSIWAKLYGTKSWQPGLFRKCSYDVLACVEKKDGSRRVISIRTYDGKWDHNKLNEETVICWQPMPQPPKGE